MEKGILAALFRMQSKPFQMPNNHITQKGEPSLRKVNHIHPVKSSMIKRNVCVCNDGAT